MSFRASGSLSWAAGRGGRGIVPESLAVVAVVEAVNQTIIIIGNV